MPVIPKDSSIGVQGPSIHCGESRDPKCAFKKLSSRRPAWKTLLRATSSVCQHAFEYGLEDFMDVFCY